MPDLYPVAGAKFYIGGKKASQIADFVAGDFATGITWVEVDGWETMGGLGDKAEVIKMALINRGRDVKQKGTRDAGSMENRFAVIPGDAGQAAMIAAEKTRDNYAFKIVYDDKVTVGGTGSIQYFIGLVTSSDQVGGDANTIRLMQCNVEVNSNLVTVAAT